MKVPKKILLKKLEKASKEGVLIYKEDKLSSPQEIVNTLWVHEEMSYVPDFIVVDEDGKVKEIWYGNPDLI